jgi:hypothetical protein
VRSGSAQQPSIALHPFDTRLDGQLADAAGQGGGHVHERGQVGKFHPVAHRKSELMDQLANEKTLDNVEAGLKSALDDFKASWK